MSQIRQCVCGMHVREGESCVRRPCAALTMWAGSANPRGCICPPGANVLCENQLCPRKPMLSAMGSK